MSSDCNKPFGYILDQKNICDLEPCLIQPLTENYNTQYITNNIIQISGLVGFDGAIEPAGCSGEIITQENHILAATGGSVTPKNIVIRTEGQTPSTFGSYFRDDTLTSIKGNVRGSGANDFSVSRTACSQVASGAFSSILGGVNNTASGELSIVVGGSNNISSGVNSSVLSGNNQTNSGKNSWIGGGNTNVIQSGGGTGGTGFHLIGTGEKNTIQGGDFQVIVSGSNNTLQNGASSFNSIISGTDQSIGTNTKYSFIASGSNNTVNDNYSAILSGTSNQILNKGQGYNVISTGSNNIINTGNYNTIVTGSNQNINTNNSFGVLLSGFNNSLLSDSSFCLVGTGNNNRVQGDSSVIISGTGNTAGSLYSFVGSGQNNIVNGLSSVILSGTNNLIQTPNTSYNVILSGTNNFIDLDASASFIGSGTNNTMFGNFSAIICGIGNTASAGGIFNVIGGGANNIVSGQYNSILCGSNNRILTNSRFNSISSGINNLISTDSSSSFIGAGSNNTVTGFNNVITSGQGNTASGSNNFIGSGSTNIVSGGFNSIGAGESNNIRSNSSFNAILAGSNNLITTGISNSFIGVGINNSVSGNNSSILAGQGNSISGTNSTIGGGVNNNISINNSFVCGEGLKLTQYNYPSAAFGRFNLEGITGAAGGSTGSFRIFMVGNGSSTNPTNAFSVTQDGVCIAGLVFATGGADFAEYFESHSRYTEKLPHGHSVVMIDERFIGKSIDLNNNQFVDDANSEFTTSDIGKIMLSEDVPNYIIPFGVVVGQSGFVGNAHEEEWSGKYLRDENNNYIYENIVEEKYEPDYLISFEQKEYVDYEIKDTSNNQIQLLEKKIIKNIPIKTPLFENYPLYDACGNFIQMIQKQKMKKVSQTFRERKMSPDYDPNQIYQPRSIRPEWNLIGLLGQVLIKNDQRTKSTWKKMKTYNSDSTFYLIK